jgi:hypothetical protein
MKPNVLLPDGSFDFAAIQALSRAELSAFVRACLSTSTDSFAEGEFPHLTLSIIYRALSSLARETFQEIVLDFLSTISRGAAAAWSGDAGDELIMLAEDILVESSRREEALDLLLDIIGSYPLPASGEVDLRLRALGAVLSFKHRGTREFWLNQHEIGGTAYAPSVFEGLASIDPRHALEWVKGLADEHVMADVLNECLPVLFQDYGVPSVLAGLKAIFHELPESAREAVLEIARFEELSSDALDFISVKGVPPSETSRWVLVLGQLAAGEMEPDLPTAGIGQFVRSRMLPEGSRREQEERVHEALEVLIGRWTRQTWSDAKYSGRLLSLLATFPSIAGLAVTTRFLDSLLHSPGLRDQESKVLALAGQALEALASSQNIAQQLASLGSPERATIWLSYQNVLVEAVGAKKIAEVAYRQIVASGPGRKVLLEATQKGLLEGGLEPAHCLVYLTETFGTDEAQQVLGSAFRNTIDSDVSTADAIELAGKIYRIAPSLLEDATGLDPATVSVLEDMIVPFTLPQETAELTALATNGE